GDLSSFPTRRSSDLGLELEVALTIQLHVILKRLQFEPMRLELRTENVTRAARVRQQVPDLYLGRHIGVRIIGQDLADGIVQRQRSEEHTSELQSPDH